MASPVIPRNARMCTGRPRLCTAVSTRRRAVQGLAGAGEQSGEDLSPEAYREWRERNAYTLDTAAVALGISRRMVAYYEQGKKPIPRVVALATRALEFA